MENEARKQGAFVPLAPEMPGSDEIVALQTADWGDSVFRQGILSAALIAQAAQVY